VKRPRHNFRLSVTASRLLRCLAQQYGLRMTEIIELALRTLAQHPPLVLPLPKKQKE
jgi:hypothetical protein